MWDVPRKRRRFVWKNINFNWLVHPLVFTEYYKRTTMTKQGLVLCTQCVFSWHTYFSSVRVLQRHVLLRSMLVFTFPVWKNISFQLVHPLAYTKFYKRTTKSKTATISKNVQLINCAGIPSSFARKARFGVVYTVFQPGSRSGVLLFPPSMSYSAVRLSDTLLCSMVVLTHILYEVELLPIEHASSLLFRETWEEYQTLQERGEGNFVIQIAHKMPFWVPATSIYLSGHSESTFTHNVAFSYGGQPAYIF